MDDNEETTVKKKKRMVHGYVAAKRKTLKLLQCDVS